jgi:hypothetical protein
MNIRLLKNAHIYTGNPEHLWANALAIANDRIVALDREAAPWCEAPGAVVEDLNGATILPGFTDAHIHLTWYALGLQGLDLHQTASLQSLQCQVAERVAVTPRGEWIRGRGWDQNLWEPCDVNGASAATSPDRGFPTAADLDEVAPQHPVVLIAKSGHALVANTMAMRIAGVASNLDALPFGSESHLLVARDADGVLTGMFFEDGMDLILDAIPDPSLSELIEAQALAQTHLLAAGITTIHDVDGGQAFTAYQALHNQKKLQVRVVKYTPKETLDHVLALGLRSGYGDDKLRYGGVKLFVDGALGSRTAAMLTPYEGEPQNLGVLTMEQEELQDIAQRAVAGHVALAIHAIGDRANALTLDALEAAITGAPPLGSKTHPSRLPRYRIEHVQLITPEDQRRLARLGIVASMQPIHAPHDRVMAERYWGDRVAYAYAWRSLLDAGAILAFGSDAPVEPFNPLLGLYAAITRCQEDGGPGPEGWRGEQRLTLEEALRAYTWGPAYAAAMEDRLGLLKPGYYADLIVLDQAWKRQADGFYPHPTPAALLETKIQRTMVGGEWRYRAP